MGNSFGVSAAGYYPVHEVHPRSSEYSIQQPLRRHQIIDMVWSLHSNIVCQMFSIWYIPEFDLFETRHNNKLAALVSPVPDRWAVVVDAMSIAWDRPWVYTYPQTALMQRVLHKLVYSDQCPLVLVAPLQHYHLWLPMLLGLLVDFPQEVPPLPQPSQTGSFVCMELIEHGLQERRQGSCPPSLPFS